MKVTIYPKDNFTGKLNFSSVSNYLYKPLYHIQADFGRISALPGDAEDYKNHNQLTNNSSHNSYRLFGRTYFQNHIWVIILHPK